MIEEFLHQIDNNNFFYESIVTLAYTQFGINELFARGFVIAGKKTHPLTRDYLSYINGLGFPDEVRTQILNFKGFTPMIFVPGFGTKDKTRVYRMEPNTSAVQFFLETQGITDKNIELTHMTIIAAWEKILLFDLADGPILQFFRHVRNAAAHNGKFYFVGKTINQKTGELLKPAQWNSFEIKANMQNQPLFVRDKNDTIGFWDQGDLIQFLLAFQTHYPAIIHH